MACLAEESVDRMFHTQSGTARIRASVRIRCGDAARLPDERGVAAGRRIYSRAKRCRRAQGCGRAAKFRGSRPECLRIDDLAGYAPIGERRRSPQVLVEPADGPLQQVLAMLRLSD